MNRNDQPTLSEQGVERRNAMLDELRDEMARHHRRRRTLRGGLSALAGVSILLAGLIAFGVFDQPGNHRPADSTAKRHPIEPPDPLDDESPRRVRIVSSGNGVVDRYTRKSDGDSGTQASIQRISDAELLGLLAEMNRPTGLIRFSHEVRLTDAVVDPPSEQQQPNPGDAQFDSRRDTAGPTRS